MNRGFSVLGGIWSEVENNPIVNRKVKQMDIKNIKKERALRKWKKKKLRNVSKGNMIFLIKVPYESYVQKWDWILLGGAWMRVMNRCYKKCMKNPSTEYSYFHVELHHEVGMEYSPTEHNHEASVCWIDGMVGSVWRK